jgi:nicotinamide riboside kinase
MIVKSPKIYVITGAESTGKSELAKWLAGYFNVPFIPEFARTYIEGLNRKYNYEDVEFIARKQVEQLHSFMSTNYPLIFADTWLIITKIWFDVVFGKEPLWLEEEILKTKIDLFLVCDTDLPWQPDPVRENGGKKRLILHKMYKDTIEKYNFDYQIISGQGNERFKNALKCIESQNKVNKKQDRSDL